VIASTPINSVGDFQFNVVPVGVYSVQLTIYSSIGTFMAPAIMPLTKLPNGWANTGEFTGNDAGNDGDINGISSTISVMQGNTISSVNFGINHLPESMNLYALLGFTPGSGQLVSLNNTSTWAGPYVNTIGQTTCVSKVFMGSDFEDQPALGLLTGKTIKIESLIPNIGGIVNELFYNGDIVYAGQIIYSYNPLLFQFRCTNIFQSPGTPLNYNTSEFTFSYSYIDAAGMSSPSSTFYSLRWPIEGSPLPIVLSSFGVSEKDCKALLNWKTISEINSDKFEVEYSTTLNGNFRKLITLLAKGNSSSGNNYQFSYSIENGVSYYFRLKMFEKDGTFKYSEIRKISCERNQEVFVTPSYTSGTFKIHGMKKGENILGIYNNIGKLLKVINVTLETTVDISNLSAGLYILKIKNENGTISTEKIIKN
jgi:hypothetical protein